MQELLKCRHLRGPVQRLAGRWSEVFQRDPKKQGTRSASARQDPAKQETRFERLWAERRRVQVAVQSASNESRHA